MPRCQTRYPIILVHGLGFRDYEHFGYWGRIPEALAGEGAKIYLGQQDSWASVEHNAAVLAKNIRSIIEETGCEKLNAIAHSKGGLELRYAISKLGVGEHIASLTTVATPHRGSEVMERICRLPRPFFRAAARLANPWWRMLGDENPDFNEACRQLTCSYARAFNAECPDDSSIFYQSYAAAMRGPFSDMLLFIPNLAVAFFEGENDGLVSVNSAKWGAFQGTLRGCGVRGVSHGDEIDLRRTNLSKPRKRGGVCDIREVYVEIVEGLVRRGF